MNKMKNINMIDKYMELQLRSYQKIGKNALSSSDTFLLADDMGLGKTIQAISALKEKTVQQGVSRALIVVPNSLKTNWANELQTWFSEGKVHVLSGNKENRLFYLKMQNL